MIKHHLRLAFRNFLRYKSSFLINFLGLSTGLACTLLIFLWVKDELGMNKFHEKDDRLFQVMEFQTYDEEIMTTTSTPGLLAETLKEEVPEIEHAATTTWVSEFTLSVNDQNLKAEGWYVGPDFFNIFSFGLVEGNSDGVLQDRSSIVISRSLAYRLFETTDGIIGKTIEFEHDRVHQVTGIFEDIPSNSSMQFDFVLSYEVYKDENEWVHRWGNNGPSTYVTLIEGTNAMTVTEKIADFVKERNEDSHVELFLNRYSERYLYGRYEDGIQAGGRIEYVKLFSAIALFILLIACINFMNLSTARAERRAKEVGVKKVVGASRFSLITQYLTESTLISMASVVAAYGLVAMFLPEFNLITDKEMTISQHKEIYSWSVIVALLTGILAGSYPALYLSGFRPSTILKGQLRGSWGELFVRRGLVVFQFTLSIMLVVAVIVVSKQIDYVQTKNLGYDKDNVVYFEITGSLEENLDAFISQVKQMAGVINASSVGHDLIGRQNNTSGLQWPGKNPEERILFENVRVNYDLLETMNIELREGRSFSRSFGSDSSKIILNEAAINVMKMDDPLGQVIRLWDQYDLEIIGVVKDFHFQSLHENVNPLFFMLNPQNTWNIMVRIAAGREKETLESLGELYTEFNPGFPFDYDFMDEEYALQYAAEQRVSTLSRYFAGFAILISCLGLFGLAAYTAQRRIKEVGIRKILGSSAFQIILLLSKDFTRLVLAAIIVALPDSYYLVSQWLDRFAYRIELNPWYFATAGLLALLIAWLTVASQAFRAARVNPAECLKTE